MSLVISCLDLEILKVHFHLNAAFALDLAPSTRPVVFFDEKSLLEHVAPFF